MTTEELINVDYALWRAWQARQAKNVASKDDKLYSDQVKAFFEETGETEWVNGERGIRGYLTEKKSPTWNITEAPDEIILYLARQGILSVSEMAFRYEMNRRPDMRLNDALKYRSEGVTYQLNIEKGG